MLRATATLLSAATKRSTGLTGLAVVPNAREVLIKLYEKTLDDVKIIPETAAYRQVVEAFTKNRLELVKKNEDVAAIEDAIGEGQAEELIEQAKNELQLIPQYATWKLWEQKATQPNDDVYEDLYDELEYLSPQELENRGLRNLSRQAKAKLDERRQAAAAAAAAKAAAAAAPAPAPAAAPKQ